MSDKLRVLVVDDEQVVREHFSQHIPWEETGFCCMGTAHNGREAIAMMEQELPDLVFTDITMPVMDGLEFAAYVREHWPQVKLIFLTAHDEFAYARQAVVLGAKNYLLKIGLTREQIIEACREVAAEWEERTKGIRGGAGSSAHESLARDWAVRSHLLRMVLSSQEGPEKDRAALLFREWVDLEGTNYAVISLLWDLFPWNKLGLQELEEILEGQVRFAEKVEELAREQRIQAAAFPGKATRLIVIASSPAKDGFADFQVRLRELASRIASASEACLGVRCQFHISELASGRERLIPLIQEGQTRLLDRFYYTEKGDRQSPALPYAEPDRAHTLEMAASITGALREGEEGKLKELLDRLLVMREPAYSPQFLLDVAQWVIDHGTALSAAGGKLLRFNLDLVCSREQYMEWWERLKEHMLLPQIGASGKEVRREIRLIRQYVGQHYHTPLQMSDVAQAVHLNPAYLGQMFKQETGEYLSDYINRIRIHKAKELLEGTNMKIYEVAQAVGLTDYRYFCKMFKKWIGYTPTQYKRTV
ncbi:response regulator transcription factor [Paenibacillus senegalensis]|uniref:response regulator transcription factor n=1 Tax=Paenibacillus senegalensis TaxID=1465766 RepID=UPI000287E902|nr:response regulator [Paenibacillus senegalensis]